MNLEYCIKFIFVSLLFIFVYLIYLSTCLTIVIQNGFEMYNEKLNHIKFLLTKTETETEIKTEIVNKHKKQNKKQKQK